MGEGTLKTGTKGLVGQIRKAIGASPDEEVTFVTPQFERPASWPSVASPPADRAAFEALATYDRAALLEIGLAPWDDTEDGTRTLWLYPGVWYQAIPAGLPIVDINFREETFVPGQTDNDIRFGCLAFGVLGALNRKPAAESSSVSRGGSDADR